MVLVIKSRKYSRREMSKIRRIILDETAFVCITRNERDFDMKPELARFIEKCRKKNPYREFQAYSTKVTQKRLGFGWFYNTIRNTFTRNTHKMGLYQKRLGRREIARKVIVQFLVPKKLKLKPKTWSLMDLHLFANENKREVLNRPLLPHEVISLDVCINALIANEYGLPLFSFNEDYQYFITLPGGKKPFIQYWKPADVLKQMSV